MLLQEKLDRIEMREKIGGRCGSVYIKEKQQKCKNKKLVQVFTSQNQIATLLIFVSSFVVVSY